jgi:acetoin:2,6-dichlorophenolindophenol oxidoreductase subunit beta
MAKLWRAINAAQHDAMQCDTSVVLFGQDVGGPGGPYGLTRGLQAEFGPSRVRDAPISEIAIAGCAVGAAMLGLRPIVEIMFLDFIGLALDQLVNNGAKYRFYMTETPPPPLPLVVRTLYGGRANMGPQHSQSLEAWLCHVPGLKVAFPSTPQCAYDVLRAAVADDEPVVVIEPIALLANEGGLDTGNGPAAGAPGISRKVRSGGSLTIVSYGPAVALCEEAIDRTGVDADLIDLRWLQPWDFASVMESVERTTRLVIVHDAVEPFGLGAEIAARVGHEGFWFLDAPIVRVGARFSAIPVRRRDWSQILPDAERVAAAIREVLGL